MFLMKKILPFFPSVIFCFIIISGFFLCLGQLEDSDIWLHLKAGQWIIDNFNVPHTQLFSYAIGNVPWVDHSWFFQALIFLVYRFLGGINALIVFKAVIVSLILWVSLKRPLNQVYMPVYLSAGWLFSLLLLERVPVRPEIISTLFLSVYLYILFNRKNLWWLIVIQLFWVNVHGYAIFGPVLLALFIVCEFIKKKIKLPFDWNKIVYLDKKEDYEKSLIVLFISVVLFLISPYGIGNLKYPFLAIKSFFNTANNYYYINELSNLPIADILFTQKAVLVTFAVCLFMISLLVNIRRLNLFNVIIFVIFLLLLSAADRHKGFFAVAFCFCVLDNFQRGDLGYFKRFLKKRYFSVLSIALTILIGFLMIRHQLVKIMGLQKEYVYSEDLSSKSYMFGVDRCMFPEKDIDFIIENNIKGPIFNGFEAGSYLIWRLYPSDKVFIDGRTEVYGREFMGRFVRAVNNFERWKELDKRFGFNAVILDYSSTDLYYYLIRNLYEDKQWKLVYFGDVFVVFIKNNLPLAQGLLADFAQEPPTKTWLVNMPPAFPEYFLNKARFYIDALNMPELALKNLEKAKMINPECYEVYQLTGYTYFKMRDFEKASEAFMQSLRINPNIAEPYLNLGSTLAEMGLFKQAESLYKQALYLDKNNKYVKDNLERLLKSKPE